MKKLATACAFICLGAPLHAATISGTAFSAIFADNGSFGLGSGTALSDPSRCDPSTGTGCDLSTGAFAIDFVDEDTFEFSLFDPNRAMGGPSTVLAGIFPLNYLDGVDPVAITDVTYAGAEGGYNDTPVVDFTANSIILMISNLSDEDFKNGQTLRFDITTATSLAAVPLPAGIGLLSVGALGLLGAKRRKDKMS